MVLFFIKVNENCRLVIQSMGSVKLELMDSRGNKILTTRKLKVSVKDKYGNLKKKELDATVKITDTKGKTIEVNSKCHDTKVM